VHGEPFRALLLRPELQVWRSRLQRRGASSLPILRIRGLLIGRLREVRVLWDHLPSSSCGCAAATSAALVCIELVCSLSACQLFRLSRFAHWILMLPRSGKTHPHAPTFITSKNTLSTKTHRTFELPAPVLAANGWRTNSTFSRSLARRTYWSRACSHVFRLSRSLAAWKSLVEQ